MAFKIVTDSGNDSSPEMIRDEGLVIVPLPILMDGQPYRDIFETEEQIKEFYHLIRDEGKVATTSQMSMDDFLDTCRGILSSGDDVLFLGFTSGLSASTPEALEAIEALKPEFPDRTIIALDTLCVSGGQSLLLTYAVRLQRDGKSIEEVAQWVLDNRLRIGHQFTTDDLMYLHRGGRVSKASAIAGTALSIKPVLHVDDEGKLIMLGKSRGRRKSMRALVDKAGETAQQPFSEQTVYINHGDCLDEAKVMGQMLTDEYGVTDITYVYCTPVIGAHSGPGTMSIFYLCDENKQR